MFVPPISREANAERVQWFVVSGWAAILFAAFVCANIYLRANAFIQVFYDADALKVGLPMLLCAIVAGSVVIGQAWARRAWLFVVGLGIFVFAFVATISNQITTVYLQQESFLDMGSAVTLINEYHTTVGTYPQGDHTPLTAELLSDLGGRTEDRKHLLLSGKFPQYRIPIEPLTHTPFIYTYHDDSKAVPYTITSPATYPHDTLRNLVTLDGSPCDDACTHALFDRVRGTYGAP